MSPLPLLSIASQEALGSSGGPLEPLEEAGTTKHQALKVSF